MNTDLDRHLNKIFEKALQNGVNQKDLKRLAKIKNSDITVKYDQQPYNIKYAFLIISLVVGLFSAGLPNEAFNEPIAYMRDLFAARVLDVNAACLFSRSYLTTDLFRPVNNCVMCRNVTKVCLIYFTYVIFMEEHAFFL